MSELLRLAKGAKLYDLSQPLHAGMPHFPTHPPFAMALTKLHGEYEWPNGASSASELISMGGHTGTHIDALNHFSCDGRLHGGLPVKQSPSAGVSQLSIAGVGPIVRRGVLFDIARHVGVDPLPAHFAITPEHLDNCAARVEPGDIVLLRTGWARYWSIPRQYVTGGPGVAPTGPGPELAGARWLSSRGIFAAGSDTLAFERVPSAEMAVHVHLLFESGIHIIENLNLEDLARDRVTEFLFVAAPLRIAGGTGSPLRPLALAV